MHPRKETPPPGGLVAPQGSVHSAYWESWARTRPAELQMNKEQWKRWNTDILYFLEVEFEKFEVEEFSEIHFRVTRLRDNLEMDFWPSTRKGCWLIPGRKPVSFFIPDLEAYLVKMFINK